ncbi:MAG: lipoate--protein ligase family protein [Ignavibacteria bacterium]|nr:lipoate--protein ligase family protein [Ignavibacteria bacterium]
MSSSEGLLYLDHSYPSPEENLACDHALFEACEDGECDEVLRFWHTDAYFVVGGYTNRISTEVYIEACEETGTPVLRRFSGGGTVVQGPGCFNYSLILRPARRPDCETISGTNILVMKRHRDAMKTLLGGAVEFAGISDLTLRSLKFSGNAQRRGRDCVLFHGTFLLTMDLSVISRLLPPPSKSPDYRMNRSHAEFLTNINVEKSTMKDALLTCWNAHTELQADLGGRIQHLVRTRYANPAWIFRY